MEHKLIFILIMTAALLFTGCDSLQVNDRMYVRMIGVTETYDSIELTVQAFDTSAADEKTVPEYVTYTGSGKTIYEAADDITSQSAKEVYFGQCRLLFADEKALTDTELLHTLPTLGIPSSCELIYSERPRKTAERTDSNNTLIGAEYVTSELDRHRSSGAYFPATLRDIITAKDSAKTIVLPSCNETLNGIAVIGSETAALSETEAKLYNFLAHDSEITLFLPEDIFSMKSCDTSAYVNMSDTPRLEITVNAEAQYKGTPPKAAEEEIRKQMTSLIKKAYKNDFAYTLEFLPDIPNHRENMEITVNVRLE